MEQLVVDKHSDLGITYLPIPHQGVEFIKVGKIRMAIYGLKKFGKGYSLKDLPFVIPIAPIQGTPSGVCGLDGWPEHLFERQIQFRVEMMETALQLCRHGVAVAFLPEFVVSLANAQSTRELKLEKLNQPEDFEPIQRDVFLIQRKGAAETKMVREIAKALRKLS
jgi:DNA-binding transcriptional LysR family regulator